MFDSPDYCFTLAIGGILLPYIKDTKFITYYQSICYKIQLFCDNPYLIEYLFELPDGWFGLLLPDAELAEDSAENFVGGDVAEDGAEVVAGLAEVFGH